MEDDALEFIAELEKKRGGPINWRTYATWYANSNQMLREFGVFLYQAQDAFYFEDFERNPSLFGISLKPRKKQEPFVKYEGSFERKAVVSTRPVPKVLALKVAQGSLLPNKIRTVNFFDRIFRQLVEMVELKDGTIHFFELMDRKQFIAALQQE